MKNDIGSNYVLLAAIAAISNGVGTVNSTSVDHAKASSVSFHLNAGTFGASATLDLKAQYSDDDTIWTDYPVSDPAGNDDAIVQMVAAGEDVLNIPNPRGRYSRVVMVTGVAAVVAGVTSILGPLRHVAAA